MFLGVVERLCDQLSGTFGDLVGALDCANSHILAGISCTFTDVFGRAHGMQRNQVAGPFANTLGSLAGRLACAFTNITAAPAELTGGTLSLGWGRGLGLGALGLRSRRLSLRRILTLSGKAKSQRRKKQQYDRSSHKLPPADWMSTVLARLHF
jgi:hypothetical protein